MKKRIIDITDFVKAVDKGDDVSNVTVRKQMAVTTEVIDTENRVIRFIASTGAVDRDSDTIDPNGWDLSDFLKNPVVQWCHDYHLPPLGKVVAATITDGKLIEDVKFIDPQELYPGVELKNTPEWVQFADMTYKMCKSGYLNAVSVGFDPTDYTYNRDRGGMDFKRQSQLELSVVPVPANQEALRVAGLGGAEAKLLKAWAVKAVEIADSIEATDSPEDTAPTVGVKAEGLDEMEEQLGRIKGLAAEVVGLFDQIAEKSQKLKSTESPVPEELDEAKDPAEDIVLELDEPTEEIFEVDEAEVEQLIAQKIMELTGKIV